MENEISTEGYLIINDIYTPKEVEHILKLIDDLDTTKDAFRKSADHKRRVIHIEFSNINLPSQLKWAEKL